MHAANRPLRPGLFSILLCAPVLVGAIVAAPDAGAVAPPKAGGTLYYLTKRPAEHLDPQRTYIGRDIGNESPLVYRTLTNFLRGERQRRHQAGARRRHRCRQRQ